MRRVLLVEDNECNRDMLSRRLQRGGWEVITACDGREGLETARRERPDLVLMDLSLPVMSGWDAIRAIRDTADVAATPVIALSAHAMVEDRERAFAAGCDGFATKPVEFGDLVMLMDSLRKDDVHGNGPDPGCR